MIEIKVDARHALAQFGPNGIPDGVRKNLRAVIPDLTRRLGAKVEQKLDTELKSRRRLEVKKEMVENPRTIVGRVRTVTNAEPKLLPQWLETGTRAHYIVARNASALSFFWPRVNAHVMFKQVWHPGFAGINYMQRSFQEMEGEIFASIVEAGRAGARDAA